MGENPEEASPFVGEPTDTRGRIMQATFETIQENGFAGLSIQRIASRADLSKSSVYHFFEDKDDLLLAFLDEMLGQFGGPLEGLEDDAAPLDVLWAYIDFGLYGVTDESIPPVERMEIQPGRPYVELRSQGTYSEEYRDRFTEMDGLMRDRLTNVLERGIREGTFRDVDPERTAEFLLTVLLGGLFRRATADDVDIDAVRREVEAIIEVRVLNES
ncbi:TetR/AcrR family transcriptional regulator [Halapricum hydrolyticum]|uniref:TetR/AcrR family transcriptional regulator n=1 Tax=Halapricum hydrolyticum TaxID=2979991 RepID=A0AAE3ICF2_9EURY|nr:TetR/AcrR family transcriptional regulator [Halapricum hydrolyticum]MCU4719454.1 TetR/AcrR family transcriptional regulator [Halapricum hydrolyticum]MCU4728065.1 TetR/AcrR family transcriptional regulator [Halapricum hydrolyticum]